MLFKLCNIINIKEEKRKPSVKNFFLKLSAILLVITLILTVNPYVAFAESCEDGNHKYIVIEEISATETQDGRITYECEICGNSFTKITFAEGHRWSEWSIEKEPTCTQDGEQTRRCDVDVLPHFESQSLPALGHNYEITETQPTCTKQGERLYKCTRCGDSYSENFGELLVHNYEEQIIKESTCTDVGVKQFACTICGDKYTEKIPALGHNFGEWKVKTSAEIDKDGERYKQCSICGEIISEVIPALPKTIVTKKTFPIEAIITSANILVFIIMAIILTKEFFCFAIHKKKIRDKILGKNINPEKEDGYELV